MSTDGPNLDAVRWILIGMALSSRAFLMRIGNTVDVRRAFGDCEAAEEAILSLEAGMIDNLAKNVLKIDFKDGEPLGNAMLRALESVDRQVWQADGDYVLACVRDIQQLAEKLGRMASVRKAQRGAGA